MRNTQNPILNLPSAALVLCPAIVMASLCLLPACGCKSEPASAMEDDHDHDHDHDHAGHHAPAHKPKDLPEAVKRLRELNDKVELMVGRGKRQSLVEDRTLPIALDIATWLPEIAADSDLPEPLWNTVNRQSEIIVAHYRQVIDSAEDTPGGPLRSAEAANDQPITELEKILAGADPGWFRRGLVR